MKYVFVLTLLMILVLYAYNTLFAPRYADSYDKILFISGSYTHPYLLTPWRWYLERHFPNSDIEIISGYYGYREGEQAQLAEMKDQVVSRLRTLDDTAQVAIIAYSYGGVLLDAAYHQLLSTTQVPQITQVITIASPLARDDQYLNQEFIDSRYYVNFTGEGLPNHQVVCGHFDSLVSCNRAQYSGQSSQSITATWSNHYTYILPQLVSGRTILSIVQGE